MTYETDERFPVTEWEFGDLRLRRFRDSDAEDVVVTCCDPATRQYLANLPDPYTVDTAYEYIRGPATDAWKRGRAQWAIADAADDRVLGSIGVPRIAPAFGVAEIGYFVAPWARGRGIAARATTEVAGFLFHHEVARAELHIMAGNLASQRAAFQAGFTLDGKLRKGMATQDGHRIDRWVFGRAADDPPGPSPRAIPDLPDGTLTDGVVTLRPLCADDTDAHFQLLSLPDVWQRTVPPQPPKREVIEALCEYGAAEEWLHGASARMTIRDAATGAYAGEVSVYNRMGPPGEAMLSYSLEPGWRGRGFVTRAVRLAAEWAFKELGTRRLMAGTASDNAASQAVLARAGFTNEGTQRALLPGQNDTRVDNVCWSMLPGEL